MQHRKGNEMERNQSEVIFQANGKKKKSSRRRKTQSLEMELRGA